MTTTSNLLREYNKNNNINEYGQSQIVTKVNTKWVGTVKIKYSIK